LKIVPVIDILNGIVVHAVKGKRTEYGPLKSGLCDSVDPSVVASSFKAFGFSELYIADLDAILGKSTNASIYEQITEKTGLAIMVDAGVANLDKAQELLDHKVSKVIVGTETLYDFTFINEVISRFGPEKVIVSLDLMNSKVLSKSIDVILEGVFALAHKIQNVGVTEMIVLDLARVGSSGGVDFSLLKELRSYLQMSLIVGGGVRGINDLVELKEIGVDGVLLATVLHSGAVSFESLRQAGLL
jgi:HisA/HisF family protein